MTDWVNKYINRGKAKKIPTMMLLDEDFKVEADGFSKHLSEQRGYKIGHTAIYETLVKNNPDFRQYKKSVKEAHASKSKDKH